MNRLLDHRLVRQCAPTLAGLKVGSLFCLESSPSETLCKQLAHWNKELNPRGVCVRVIAERCGYDDYGYCLRLFRQFTGHTPNQYRKLLIAMNVSSINCTFSSLKYNEALVIMKYKGKMFN